MQLKVLSSGSRGNCYILNSDTEAIVIEAGATFIEVKKALNFDIKKIKGVIVGHAHLDHSRHIKDYENSGIPTFKPYESEMERQVRTYGKFVIKSFPCVHDIPCFGFLIEHPDMGKLLYASDTEYIKYNFSCLNHMLIECNHETELVSGENVNFEHSLTGHMSLETCKEFIKANDNHLLKNVILCHMSDKNINEERALATIKGITSAKVWSAHTHNEIDLRIVPF